MAEELWIVLGPVFTGIVGLLVWALQRRIEEFRRERARLHDDRRRLYMQIIEPLILSFYRTQGSKVAEIMLSESYLIAAREFSLVGSDEAVRAMNDLMQYFFQQNDSETRDYETVFKLLGLLFLEIRRDLGNKDTKVSEIDMFRGQITDIDSLIAPRDPANESYTLASAHRQTEMASVLGVLYLLCCVFSRSSSDR